MEITSQEIQSTYDEYDTLMSRVAKKYKKYITYDEINNCKLHAVYKALKTYDKDKHTKFSTFLCYHVNWEIGDFLKTEMRFKIRHKHKVVEVLYNLDIKTVDMLIDMDSFEHSDIARDKIEQGMSFSEIAKKYKIGKETARKRFLKFIKNFEENGV